MSRELSEHPPYAWGDFQPLYSWWLEEMPAHVVDSAFRFGALVRERRGKRGGWYYAAVSGVWQQWVAVYKDRVEKRKAAEARYRIVGPQICGKCVHLVSAPPTGWADGHCTQPVRNSLRKFSSRACVRFTRKG